MFLLLLTIPACSGYHPSYNAWPEGYTAQSEADKDRAVALEIARRQYLGQIFQNQHVAPTKLYDPNSPEWAEPRRSYEPLIQSPAPSQRRMVICNRSGYGSQSTTLCY